MPLSFGSINCGKKAKKNKVTFGLKTLVSTPEMYTQSIESFFSASKFLTIPFLVHKLIIPK